MTQKTQDNHHREIDEDLIKSVIRRDIENVRQLLEAGADPNACSASEKSSSLTKAVDLDAVELIKLLMVHGGDPNLSFDARSSFSRACGLGQKEVIGIMLEFDGPIKINILDSYPNGTTPAMRISSYYSSSSLMEKLQNYFEEKILYDEDKNPKFDKGHLWLSVENKGRNSFMSCSYIENMQWILDQNFTDQKKMIESVDKEGRSALWLAVRGVSNSLVEFLLSRGARTDITDSTGLTLLEMAEKEVLNVTHKHGNPEDILSQLRSVDASRKAMKAINDLMGTCQNQATGP